MSAGEVHALVGENGAGKSTLIKVLTGVERADAGSITFLGRPFAADSPAAAQRAGISTVYQEKNGVPNLSVADNLFLNRQPRRWWGLDRRAQRHRARDLLRQLDLDLDVDRPLGEYSVAVQQMVAIARAVDEDARLLILDEPTSSLDRRETGVLIRLVGELKARGLGILFVTHFLDQVFAVADRVTVLRNGERVGTFARTDLDPLGLVTHMLGHGPEEAGPRAPSKAAPEVLCSEEELGDVRTGEVLGLAGLLGSGRTELARRLFEGGSVRWKDRAVLVSGPRAAIALGMGLCPEDRQAEGLFEDMSVGDNIALAVRHAPRAERDRIGRSFVERLKIVTSDLKRPVRNLSGGNQQKVILARWLACRPELLILDEPTRGIDVGAKAEIERLVDGLARDGMAILFISAELEEVVRRCHRVRVLRDGSVVGELEGDALSQAAILERIAEP